MDLSATKQIVSFLEKVGSRLPGPATIHVFGGSAILLVGGQRTTADLDFTLQSPAENECRSIIGEVASELGLQVEENIPEEFMPLPAGSEQRHRFFGQFGLLRVFVLDPYSMAVMKVDRAFPSDFEDVAYLLSAGLIEMRLLEQAIEDVARRYDEPKRLRQNLEELKRGL